MTDLDGKFVHVLDHWARTYGSGHWPVSLARSTLEAAREAGQYGGESPTVLSSEEFTAREIEPAALLNTRTGKLEPGTIYRIRRREDG